jgi:hypothetical protein
VKYCIKRTKSCMMVRVFGLTREEMASEWFGKIIKKYKEHSQETFKIPCTFMLFGAGFSIKIRNVFAYEPEDRGGNEPQDDSNLHNVLVSSIVCIADIGEDMNPFMDMMISEINTHMKNERTACCAKW